MRTFFECTRDFLSVVLLAISIVRWIVLLQLTTNHIIRFAYYENNSPYFIEIRTIHGYRRQHTFLWNNYRDISFRTIRCAAAQKCVTKLINTTVALICAHLWAFHLFSVEYLHIGLHFDAQAGPSAHKSACKLTEKLISALIHFWCMCVCISTSVIFSPYRQSIGARWRCPEQERVRERESIGF